VADQTADSDENFRHADIPDSGGRMVEVTRNSTDDLVPVTSLQEFFRDSVDAAMATNKLVLNNHTSHYVVNLLTMFSRSEALYESTDDGLQLKPLAMMFADAVDAPTEADRNYVLQRLGDVSLFMAGFFADGLQRAAVDMDYYVYMGGGAYHSLATHMRGTVKGRAFCEVFSELADKFQDMVDVLNEVRESARTDSDSNLLRIYELWMKTGSRRARRLLRECGVYPMERLRANKQH
jgi:hypothetical protein